MAVSHDCHAFPCEAAWNGKESQERMEDRGRHEEEMAGLSGLVLSPLPHLSHLSLIIYPGDVLFILDCEYNYA